MDILLGILCHVLCFIICCKTVDVIERKLNIDDGSYTALIWNAVVYIICFSLVIIVADGIAVSFFSSFPDVLSVSAYNRLIYASLNNFYIPSTLGSSLAQLHRLILKIILN